MTFTIYAGSWLLAMTLAILLPCLRIALIRFADPVVKAPMASYHRNDPTLVQLMLWYFGIYTLMPDAVTDWLAQHNAEAIFVVIGPGTLPGRLF